MSDETFDFDFSRVDIPHPGLDRASAAYLADAMVAEPGSRPRAVAALAAARSLVTHDLAPGTGPQTQEALSALVAELERVEYALRDLEDGATPTGLTAPARAGGRPAESNAVVDFQARAVLAAKWLQRLDNGALDKNAALDAVADTIPRALLQTSSARADGARGSKLEAVEQLVAWLDKAGRRGSRQHGRLLELWHQLTVEHDIPLSRQTSAQVLAWLRSERARLLGN